jgi:hypothetical protein
MRDAHDAGGAVDNAAEKIIIAAFGNAGMEAAAYAQRDAVGRGGIGQFLLQVKRGPERIERIIERGMGAVAAHFYDEAAMVFDGRAHDRVVASKRKPHALVLALP